MFHNIMASIFKNCLIYGQGHQKEVSSIHSELKLEVSDKVMQ